MSKILASIALVLLLSSAFASAERLIGEGEDWKYYKGRISTPPDDGGGRNWTQQTYDDSTGWGTGASGFGFGDNDDATVFSDMQHIAGTQAGYLSVFIRKTFVVSDPAAISRLTLAVDYDDGFVAYVNGTEVARRNMPAGPVSYDTGASGNHEASRGGGGGTTGDIAQEREFIEIDRNLLVAGTNVIAISGHNISITSSDFTLRPELYANVTLVRGPFLQMPDAGQISVVWRTDALTDSAVDYGSDTNYAGGTVGDGALVRHHILTLPPLPPGATIHYRVRSGGVTLAESTLHTPRLLAQPFRFAVYGDFGWGNDATGTVDSTPAAVAAAVTASNPNLTLTVGDNIYNNGQPGLYDPYWFQPYDGVNRRAPLFPALGNHDVDNPSNGQPFIDNFYLPQNGPAGYRERNYSFDYGNAHFVVLDVNPFVYRIDTTAQAAIANWLGADLAATSQRWKFVFFHQPAYTSSGTGVHSPETTLQNQLQPIFAKHGVQMVFQGHNHFYERINPINGVNYITTGGGGRSATTPSVFPTYSAVVRSGVYSFTQVDMTGGVLTLRQINSAGVQIDTIEINLDHPFTIDGLLDSTQWLRAGVSGTLRLHAAIRGHHLYLATQDAGEASDHFIYLHNQSAAMQPANWSKAGQVMQWSAFLADENSNGFKGWFNSAAQQLPFGANYSATTSGLNNNGATGNGVLEGTINLPAHFGSWPVQLYVAAAPFGDGNGGALVANAQVPAGNGDGNIQANEFLILNTRDITLDLPTSNAGPDQTAEAGMEVLLIGSGSAPSGLPRSYAWAQLSGPAVAINNATEPAASFTPTDNVAENTDVVLRLRVNDTRFDTDDTVTVQLYPMLDSDGDGLSDQEELKGVNNSLTTANPNGQITNPNVADTDADGVNDGDEALAGTDANSSGSAFKVIAAEVSGSSITIVWSSVPGRTYQLERANELGAQWEAAGDLIIASEPTTSVPVSASGAAQFYRVRLVP